MSAKVAAMGFFCSEFCSDYSGGVYFGLSGTTYAKMAKNCQKLIKIGQIQGPVSRDWYRNRKKQMRQNYRLALVILIRQSVEFYLL